MKKDYIFNFDRFEECLNNTKEELNETEVGAHNIIATISDYIDCETEFIMSISEEAIDKAIDMLHEENHGYLYSMLAASTSRSIASDAKSVKMSTKEDLF